MLDCQALLNFFRHYNIISFFSLFFDNFIHLRYIFNYVDHHPPLVLHFLSYGNPSFYQIPLQLNGSYLYVMPWLLEFLPQVRGYLQDHKGILSEPALHKPTLHTSVTNNCQERFR